MNYCELSTAVNMGSEFQLKILCHLQVANHQITIINHYLTIYLKA